MSLSEMAIYQMEYKKVYPLKDEILQASCLDSPQKEYALEGIHGNIMKIASEIHHELREIHDKYCKYVMKIASEIHDELPELDFLRKLTYEKKSIIIRLFGWALLSMEEISMVAEHLCNKKVLSVGSGCAYLEFLMQQYSGIDIVCSDISPSKDPSFMDVDLLPSHEAVRKYSDAQALFSCWTPYVMPNFLRVQKCTKCNSDDVNPYIKWMHCAENDWNRIRKNRSINWQNETSRKKAFLKKRKEEFEKIPQKSNIICSSCIDDCAYLALREFKGDTFVFIGELSGGCTGSNRLFRLLSKEWTCVEQIGHSNIGQTYSSVYIYNKRTL